MSSPKEPLALKLSCLRISSRNGEWYVSSIHETPQSETSQDQILDASHMCNAIFITAYPTHTSSVFRGDLCTGMTVDVTFHACAISGLPVQTCSERDKDDCQLSASKQRFTCEAELVPFTSSWLMDSHLLPMLSRPPQPGLNFNPDRAI